MKQVLIRVASCAPRLKSIFVGLALVAGLVGVPTVVLVPSARAATATGGYPYWDMPCELAPYNTVGYCNTKYGPYDWGPVENGSSASQNSAYGYGYRNCTDYVAWKLASLGVNPAQYKGLGEAKSWAAPAASHGLVDNTQPAVGSVAVSTAGTYGHVAFVTAVNGSQITVSQYNQAGTGVYSTQTGTAASLGFSSFVHFEKYESTSLRPPEVRDEKGHHLRERDRRLCGSLLNPPNPLPISNIKILPPEVLHCEEFCATWPYRETSFEGEISGSAEHLTVLHRQLPEV